MHDLKKEMLSAAKKKRFETAARLRNQFLSLKLLSEKQSVIFAKKVNWDLASFSSDEGFYCVNLLKVREGKLVGKENFVYDSKQAKEKESNKEQVILETFLEQYYLETSDIPKEIYLNLPVSNVEVIKNLLKARFGKSVKISVPKKGKALSLLKTSALNAKEHLKNWLTEKAGHLDKIGRALKQLQEVLGLKKIPERIECFDISNTQGTNPVASMVVFKNGLAAKSEYRKFKVQIKETPDDFSMMREIITRRLAHSLASNFQITNNKNQWPLPDLIVVDGGKGQLSTALKILAEKNINIPMIGLAKRLEEIVFYDGKDFLIIQLANNSKGLNLLKKGRDEAHRFGITYYRSLHRKSLIS
jgi:excinuclease ABC subunit C